LSEPNTSTRLRALLTWPRPSHEKADKAITARESEVIIRIGRVALTG
jgi:hypothetical protein